MATLEIYERLRKVLDEKVALELAEAIGEAIGFYEKMVPKDEFNELKVIVREISLTQKSTEQKVNELAEAQKKTEQRLNELAEAQRRTEERVNELAEAQKKTEQRLNELAEAQRRTEERVNELAEAQKRTEERVNELAEAQKKTEQRLNELAEAQRRTEQRVNELAEAQKKLAEAQEKTEKSIRKLTGVVENLKKEVGGHSHTIGHILEDKAIVKLPKILKNKFNIELEGDLNRGHIMNNKGKEEEVNVYGYGRRDGEKLFILGEGKTRFGIKDLKDFENKMKRFEGLYGRVFPIVITYLFSNSKILQELKNKNIFYLLSYELERE